MKPATCGLFHLYYKYAGCFVQILVLMLVPSFVTETAVDALFLIIFLILHLI